MSVVLLVAHTPHVVEQVTKATDGQVAVITGVQTQDSNAVAAAVSGPPIPDLLIVESGDRDDESLAIAQWAVERFRTPVVLVTNDPHRAALAAMRAGVRDMISLEADVDDYRDVIVRNRRVVGEPGESRGRVITVASPKGGVGKTTITTNIAVGLAQAAPESVVLVDLDIHFGDVATALNLSPEYTLPDVAHASATGDPLAVKPYLTRHETGLWVVPGSDNPAAADSVTVQEVSSLLQTLAQSFTHVVVDTAPGLSEHTLAALDVTNALVLVTGLDVPGVRGLRKELDTLRELSLPLDSQHIVLNFADSSRGLTVADVEASIDAKVDHVLPSTKMVPISVNQGIPLLQSRGKDPVTKGLTQLVGRFTGDDGSKTRRGLFRSRGARG